MEQTRLPIRLVPRKGALIFLAIFFCFFFGFSIFWMAGAAGILDLNDGTVGLPASPDWIGTLFPLFGLPFAAVGICGLTATLLKMRPNSPNFHVEVSSRGLLVKALFKQEQHEWSELPPFETIKVQRRTKNGTRTSYYTVAVDPPGATHEREVVRIHADEYGAKNGEEDAEALTAWFNQLRELARDGRLGANEAVDVPEGFRATAISVAAAPAAPLAGRSAPVIEQATKRDERPPTVVRR